MRRKELGLLLRLKKLKGYPCNRNIFLFITQPQGPEIVYLMPH